MTATKAKSFFERVLDKIVAEKVKEIGSISTLFTEVDEKLLQGSNEPFEIGV